MTWTAHVGRTVERCKMHEAFWLGRYHLGDLGTDPRLLFKMYLKEKKGYEDEDWIYLAQGRIKRWIPVKPVTNFRFREWHEMS
jgi:hypothetical protein